MLSDILLKGGLFGILLSMGLNLWIIIGQIVYGKNSAKNDLVFSTEDCAYPYNVTRVENITTTIVPEIIEERFNSIFILLFNKKSSF